jgi:hypothetical protein
MRPKGLRERCPALEEQAGTSGLKTVEQRVERPAHPEVLLDVLHGGAEAMPQSLMSHWPK